MTNILANTYEDATRDEINLIAFLDHMILRIEEAEHELAVQGAAGSRTTQKVTGSYYTPADVADHFWDLFFRVHNVHDAWSFSRFIADSEFIEPSAGSGIFFFSFVKKALLLGASIESIFDVSFHIIDVNLAALRFFSEKLHELETKAGKKFIRVNRSQSDFIEWMKSCKIPHAVFVGNPPYVNNAKGQRWKNLFADFLAAMIDCETTKAISLILPLSICFSRDYKELRDRISSSGLGISASSYDNRPDCLFNSGKPESTNTNRVNSQRCTILNLGGDPSTREASPLVNWMAGERRTVLRQHPTFFEFDDRSSLGQIPRPASREIQTLMAETDTRALGTFMTNLGPACFRVGGVARNYIGIREPESSPVGSIAIKTGSRENMMIALQALTSKLFFDYWRTFGDGFHVTQELIANFPVTEAMLSMYEQNFSNACATWESRCGYRKSKLNSGKTVISYDFTYAF